jgi:cytoskeletal protein CcmA (bactofilin family)
VIVGGRVNGNVFGDGRVEIQNGGQLFGDIKSSVVIMLEGGIFEGHCEMSSKEKGKILELGDREPVEDRRRTASRE